MTIEVFMLLFYLIKGLKKSGIGIWRTIGEADCVEFLLEVVFEGESVVRSSGGRNLIFIV